jgi:hypothetical protein
MLFNPGNYVGREEMNLHAVSTPSPHRLQRDCTGLASGGDCFRTGSLL